MTEFFFILLALLFGGGIFIYFVDVLADIVMSAQAWIEEKTRDD